MANGEAVGVAAYIDNEDIRNNFTNNRYFEPETTKALFLDVAKQNLAAVTSGCNAIPSVEVAKLTSLNIESDTIPVDQNIYGQYIFDSSARSQSILAQKKCETNMLLAATQIALAIKAYTEYTGLMPQDLNDLAPEYLQAIPVDPFSQNNFGYDPDKKIIYSVGKDGIEDGGSTGNDWSAMTDPTFSVDFTIQE